MALNFHIIPPAFRQLCAGKARFVWFQGGIMGSTGFRWFPPISGRLGWLRSFRFLLITIFCFMFLICIFFAYYSFESTSKCLFRCACKVCLVNFEPPHVPRATLSHFSWSMGYFNPILDGGGQICPTAGYFNIAQKPLGLGS